MSLNANAIVTVAFTKTYIKIPSADTTQDTIVEFWINAASDFIETELDRKLKSQTITEYQHGRATNTLILKQYPVTAISSLSLDSTSKFAGSEEIVDSANYGIGDDGNSVIYYCNYFPRGYNNIKVVYTAGFSTIPMDIQNAALWLITYYHKMRENGDIGRTSKGKGDESINILQEAPQEVKNMILRYRRVDVPLSNSMSLNG